jgi:hypothetical protein
MTTYCIQWEVSDTNVSRCGTESGSGIERGQDHHLTSYYSIVLSGGGRIDLRTDQLQRRRCGQRFVPMIARVERKLDASVPKT